MPRTFAATALLTIALALPAGALAMNGPTGGSSPSTSAPVNLLRDGKYLPTPTAAPATVQVVRIVRPGGFDFRDAGIGAAVGALALAVIGGIAIVLSRDNGADRATGTTAG